MHGSHPRYKPHLSASCEYLYFLNRECGNKKSSTARRLASLHGFYDYLVNQVNKLTENPTASIKPPKQDKVLPKYLTAEQSMDLLESTQYQSDFPERDYCMVVLLHPAVGNALLPAARHKHSLFLWIQALHRVAFGQVELQGFDAGRPGSRAFPPISCVTLRQR